MSLSLPDYEQLTLLMYVVAIPYFFGAWPLKVGRLAKSQPDITQVIP